MRDTALCLKLNPVASPKPRVTLDAACDVARRIGCHVEIHVNDVPVVISPVAAKGDVFQQWTETAASAGSRKTM
jgi:hypothetical protein